MSGDGRGSSGSSRASSIDSWTLINAQGAEVENARIGAEEGAEGGSECGSPGWAGRMGDGDGSSASEFARLSDDSELDDFRHQGDNTLNEAMAGDDELSECSSAEFVEATLREHPMVQAGGYVIDQAKLHRLLDALCSATSSPSEAGPSAQQGSVEPPPSAEGEEPISDELPVNWVQKYSERISNYMHTTNSGLNWKLSLLVTVASALVLGLGIGHFMGTTHNWLRRHRVARQQLDQLRSLQDSLIGCLHTKEKQETLLIGLQHRLGTCLDVSSHCGVEERPVLLDDLTARVAAAQRLARRERLHRRRAERKARALHSRITAMGPDVEPELMPSSGVSQCPSEGVTPWPEVGSEETAALEARVAELERSLAEARTTIRRLSVATPPRACPSPSRSQKDQIVSDWLIYANLSQILDSYLDALRAHNLHSLRDDTARIVWDQLNQVREVAERFRVELSERLGSLLGEPKDAGAAIRQHLETALTRVWDLTSSWAREQKPGVDDLFDHVDGSLSHLQTLFASHFHFTQPAPTHVPRPCPTLASSQDPHNEMRQFKGVLKRSSLWAQIGEAEMYPYLGELKRLSKQRPLSEEGRVWWESQQRWWEGCEGAGDAVLEWQEEGGSLGLPRGDFLAANPSVAEVVSGWGRAVRDGKWLLERGHLREQMRREEARSDWLFLRGRERSEKREEEDDTYAANSWDSRRQKLRSEHRSKGDYRPPFHHHHSHFRSFA